MKEMTREETISALRSYESCKFDLNKVLFRKIKQRKLNQAATQSLIKQQTQKMNDIFANITSGCDEETIAFNIKRHSLEGSEEILRIKENFAERT
jgi:hypothetical protein